MRTGTAHLPLHGGKAPRRLVKRRSGAWSDGTARLARRWLFSRMVKLARAISLVVIEEYGSLEMLRRLSDPFWFQAFGCVLGFDWHSSGLTTTTCGAIKEGMFDVQCETGFYAAGGKGGRSRKTPGEISASCQSLSINPAPLIYASRMAAKVDSAALQDGYQLYHHNFFFTVDGRWCVVQQGMNEETRYARRYHWLSESLDQFVCEPHQAICSETTGETLNMVARESGEAREASAALACEHPDTYLSEPSLFDSLNLPERHGIRLSQDIEPKRLHKILLKTYESQPPDFEKLLGTEGVGPKTIRALSLAAELIYGKKPSFRDPARYSFAHGGKDGIPYPVDRALYDRSIQFLNQSVSKSRLDYSERHQALKRLAVFYDADSA